MKITRNLIFHLIHFFDISQWKRSEILFFTWNFQKRRFIRRNVTFNYLNDKNYPFNFRQLEYYFWYNYFLYWYKNSCYKLNIVTSFHLKIHINIFDQSSGTILFWLKWNNIILSRSVKYQFFSTKIILSSFLLNYFSNILFNLITRYIIHSRKRR